MVQLPSLSDRVRGVIGTTQGIDCYSAIFRDTSNWQ